MITNFFKKALIASSVALPLMITSIDVHSESVAETLFDRYSANAPGTRDTNQGKVFYGGSFNAKIDTNPTDLVGFQAPSISSGCGGIDFFAGSFSLVSKDEVVQMLRGVAQGVPAYFFNLALTNVCSTCADLASELEARVGELNKWGQTSCETAGLALQNAAKESDFLMGLAKTTGASTASVDGLIEGPLDFLSNRNWGPSENKTLSDETGLPQETLNKIYNDRNKLAVLLDDIDNFDFPYVTGATPDARKENLLILLTSLSGLNVSDISSDTLKQETNPKTLTVSQLFEGDKELTNLNFYECNGAVTAVFKVQDKCSSMRAVSYNTSTSAFKDSIGFAFKIENEIFDDANGIIERIRRKSPLTAQQQVLKNLFSYSFVSMAIAKSDPQGRTQYEAMSTVVRASTKEVLLRDFRAKAKILISSLMKKAMTRDSDLYTDLIEALDKSITEDIISYENQLKEEKKKLIEQQAALAGNEVTG